MALTPKQIKYLKALAHHRKPVVAVGNAGVTAAVLKEIGVALKAHELIKIKLPAGEKSDRAAMIDDICAGTHAKPVQHIGRIAVVYRRTSKPKIQLPD